mmetsp:Transcript_64550/g.144983  ORF Transcript_64550/g.144983 Transcript_64550/m.144983 type:complete len:893 (+) Transcript_64550:67-2745(+)
MAGRVSTLDEMSSVIAALYSEFAEAPEEGIGLSLSRFCHFLAHFQVFSEDFDHLQGVQCFLQAVSDSKGVAGRRTLTKEEAKEGGTADADTVLDIRGFRTSLQIVANRLYGDRQREPQKLMQDTLTKSAALGDLIHDIHVKRETSFDVQTIGELRGYLYDIEVLQALYTYLRPLQALFHHYATASQNGKEAPAVTCRSAYLLCCAVRLVPNCVVAGEFVDIALGMLLRSGAGLTTAEKRYFDDERMLSRGEELNLLQPAKQVDISAEPRYSLPELLELLGTVALCMLPRVHRGASEERIARIHDVFGRQLGFQAVVQDDEDTFDVVRYLRKVAPAEKSRRVAVGSTARHMAMATTAAALEEVIDLSVLFSRLATELPLLPPAKGPRLPGPPPSVTATLKPQPPTAEEQVAKYEEARKNMDAAKRGGPLGRRHKKKEGKDKEKKLLAHPGDFNQVNWYEKRKPPPAPVVPPAWQCERRVDQMMLLQRRLEMANAEVARHNAPTSGWVLRMALIDEPLRAPPCPESEEVSTLIETALTSRRLRRYTDAISLLLSARRLWAALASGLDVPAAWKKLQPHVSPPSPWGGPAPGSAYAAGSPGAGLAAARASGTEVSPKGSLDATILPSELQRDDSSSPTEIREGNGEDVEEDEDDSGDEEEEQEEDDEEGEEEAESPGLAKELALQTDLLGGRRYDPTADFGLVLGRGDEDLLHLPPEVGLFFLYELSSLHSAIHEDECAARLLWHARNLSDHLPAKHPDTAVVWCALGRVAFHTGHFEVAARLTMRARAIRERTLGGDTVETATTYNNLACCFTALARPMEAVAFLELSAEILKVLAGEDHPRTQVALRNLEKARSAKMRMHLEVPHVFSYLVRDTTLVRRGGRKKKKKGAKGRR